LSKVSSGCSPLRANGARGLQAKASSAAIPDRPDWRPGPAGAETAAIVATAVKAGPAEIVQVAIVPVIMWGWIDIPRAPVPARHARNRSFLRVSWKAVIRWLTIARQEAVTVPARRRPFISRRCRRDDRQQREDDSSRQKHEARHKHTIAGRPLGGDSNLSAQSSATVSVSLCETTALRQKQTSVYQPLAAADLRPIRKYLTHYHQTAYRQ
jgi:hypothetical protein